MTCYPPDGELRAAGANLMVGQLQAELDAMLARSWRLRLASRLGRWFIALQQVARDISSGIRHIAADIDDGLLHGWRM